MFQFDFLRQILIDSIDSHTNYKGTIKKLEKVQ